MVAHHAGLIVHMSAPAGQQGYSDNVAYGVSKAAVDRMAADMAHELRAYQVAVVSPCPFMVATEMLMARRKSQRLEPWMETPLFAGRVVVALANDPQVLQKSRQVLATRRLAAQYGFTDVDGHQPAGAPVAAGQRRRARRRRGFGSSVKTNTHPPQRVCGSGLRVLARAAATRILRVAGLLPILPRRSPGDG